MCDFVKTQASDSEEEKGSLSSSCCKPENEGRPEPVNQRRRKNNLPNLDNNLRYLSSKIMNGVDISIYPNNKSTRGLHNGTSFRRSKFLGVSKNNNRFQTLINVGSRKQYIGTFWDEKEAALVYDFFAIALKKTRAKTNFHHNNTTISKMIQDYYDNGRVFDPVRNIHIIIDD